MLSKVNPREIEPSLAAHVALVQGIVYAAREPEQAIKSFEVARLLAPGSLVEQGALRRQTMVASKLGRWDQAEKLAAQYLRRFGNAVYAPTFYREIAEQLAGEPDTRDEEQFARLVRLFDLIGTTSRRQTYLLLAERAVLSGKVKMARFAAARASELYDPGSAELTRLQVYGAAANVASDQTVVGMSTLESIDRGRLGARDTLLADAAIEVGEDVRREPDAMMVQALQPADDIVPEQMTTAAEPSPVVEQARKSIGKADEPIEGGKEMTVGTVAQDRAVRLPVPDSVMAIDGAQGEGKGNAALFADLMAQLTIPDAADPDTGDEQPAAAEAKTEQPASETAASTPPTPGALQALLANALSTIVQDVKSETQLNVAVDAEASNDVLKLAQLIAQSAQGREGAPATDGAADAGEGKELKGHRRHVGSLVGWAVRGGSAHDRCQGKAADGAVGRQRRDAFRARGGSGARCAG